MQLEAVKMGHPVMNVEMNYRLGGEATIPSSVLINANLSSSLRLRSNRCVV